MDKYDTKGFLAWVDARLPIVSAFEKHMSKYYTPKNFNVWYFFGVLSMVVLVNQLLTGVWLTMSFNPSAEGAFISVEGDIMRDVDMGWLIRYMHSTGASAFFVVVYLHMYRGLMYGSYKKPRELVWIFGMTIYLVLMAEGFMGYVLPWGQMSYWGAQVIISLFGAIPYIGEGLVEWIRGDFLISGITLNRFFALHVVALPIVLLGLVVLHILALHEVGSNNPDGVEIKKRKDANGIPRDGIPFHPYYTIHDMVGIVVFLFVFCTIVFFFPEMGGYFLEHANFEEANNLKTPDHIAPVWYFTPFYSVLRAVTYPLFGVDAKLWGVMAMGGAIAILFVLPWLDRSNVKSIRYKGTASRVSLVVFSSAFIILGVLGGKGVSDARTSLAQICTVIYFLFFLAMPFYTALESTKTEPVSVRMEGGMGFWKSIGVLIVILLLAVIPLKAVGSSAKVHLDHMEVNLEDEASLQRGLSTFTNYCMGCHSAKLQRYNRNAQDLGVSEELYMDNLVFTDVKFGERMNIAMNPDVSKNWFGAAPPDLSVVTRKFSPDWMYTYLRSFYKDDKRPWGVNNKVFANVGMPHVMSELQGLQECAAGPVLAHNGGIKRDPLTGEDLLEDPCGKFEINDKGSLTPEEYDALVYDLVNYMAYLAEPVQLERKRIGVYVLLFLAFFFVFVYLLNREYWKDIH